MSDSKKTGLFSEEALAKIRQAQTEWQKKQEASEKKFPPRPAKFTTWSDMDMPLVSTPVDLAAENFDYLRDLAMPGEFPYTRGVQRNMYRGKLWTMRQFAGFS